jgi:hypothetical protein
VLWRKVWKHNGTIWLEDGWNGARYLDTVFFVVYDPAGGRATGEGWFDPDVGGKAELEFAVGYKKDASTGKLDFKD